MGNASPVDGRPQSEVQVRPDKPEVVASFCYLGYMLSAGGGCEVTVTTRVDASETWPLTKSNLQGLQRNDRAMIKTDLQYQARGCGHGKIKQTTGKASA